MERDFILAASSQAPLSTLCALMMSSVGSDLTSVCGRVVSFGSPVVHIIDKYRLPRPYEEPCVWTLAALEGAFRGEVRWILRFKDAATISGLMILVPDSELERRRRNREFSAMDADAWREACNILCGGAAQGLRDAFQTDLSMVQKETRFIDVTKSRSEWDKAFPPPPLVMVEFPVTISGFPQSVCALVLARDVLEAMLSARGVTKPFEEIRGTILLLDEGEGAQQQLSMALQGLPYHLYAAPSLLLATEGIDIENVQMVVIDIGNSKNDGFEALQKIRSTEKYAHLPVVMCCAKTLLKKEHVVRAVQLGARDFLAKPFDREILLSKLEKHALPLP